MERRKFIRNAGLAAAAGIVLPTILPSGRLFAATGSRKVNHVIWIIFGGGVRNQETVHKMEGNLMPHIFSGNEKVPAEYLSNDYLRESPNLKPLQNFGTLFKQFSYSQGPAAHQVALMSSLTGNYAHQEPRIGFRNEHQTIFDYYSHERSTHSVNSAWWVSARGSFVPANALVSILNKPEVHNVCYYGVENDIMVSANAEHIIKTHHPELLVVNLSDMDTCHSDFSKYCTSIIIANHLVSRIWQMVQNDPKMADDTVLIVAPEHGRNSESNGVVDKYGRCGLDHTLEPGGDQSAREIFCLVAGPESVIHQNKEIDTPSGESIEIVPLIGNLLDIKVGNDLKPFAECDLQLALC